MKFIAGLSPYWKSVIMAFKYYYRYVVKVVYFIVFHNTLLSLILFILKCRISINIFCYSSVPSVEVSFCPNQLIHFEY